MSERKYNAYTPYNRPKLTRNKWGIDNMTSITTSSSLFGSDGSGSGVGGGMVNIDDFSGCTQFEDGIRGLVPAPLAGMSEYFLSATGSWVEIPELKWMREFPTGKGFEKTGIQIDGDLNVTDTLTTMNLEVQGAAHFWSLIIDEVKSTGGQVLVSPSSFTVDWIGDIQYHAISTPNSQYTTLLQSREDISKALFQNDIKYFKCRRLYQRNDDTSKRTTNECVVGDMLRCRQFNLDEGSYTDVKNDDWWSFVAAVGEGTYTDESNHTYDAFYIDIVYALEKSDGRTVPLGSVLSTIESDIVYPSYWTSDIVADELKSVSQQTLDGNTTVESEYYDPEEWKEVKNHVISIRGIDDSISTLSGIETTLGANSDNIDTVEAQLGQLAYGTDSSSGSGNMNYSASQFSSLILDGTVSGNSNDYNNSAAVTLSESILNDEGTVEQSKNLIQEKSKFNSFYLDSYITTTATLYAAENMSVRISGSEVELNKGDEIPVGSYISYGGFVTDGIDFTNYKEYDTDESEEDAVDVSGEELDILTNGTKSTSFGTERDVNRSRILDYDTRSEWLFGYGEFSVKIGNTLACLGHLFNPDRQNAIVISATNPIDPDLEAPALAQYNCIDTFGESISNYRLTAIAANGNEFIGSFLVNYNDNYIDVNDRINIFVNDIKTGLETVGIHLDGDKSTITLVGNIDLRQHSSTSWDTLSLYDNREIKRLEISPFDIPSRTSPDFANITRRKFYLNGTGTSTIPSNYITTSKWKDWSAPGLFYYYQVYGFEMNNYTLSISESINLGYLKNGYDIDLSGFDINLYYPSYVCDDKYVDNYRTSNIKVYYTLRRDGNSISGKSNVDITGLFTVTPTDGRSNDIYLKSTGTVLDDYSIPTDGNYTLTIKVVFNTYMHTNKYNSGYNNPYIKSYIYLIGNGTLVYAPSQGSGDSDTSLRKMNIGTNGFSFVGNNSRYFYAATDGVEMKWDNVSIGLDPTVGIKSNHRVYTTSYISSSCSGVVPCDADIVITSNPSTAQSITLYNGNVDLGAGKEVSVIDCLKVSISNCSHPKTTYAYWTEYQYEDERDMSANVACSVRKFIWYNSEWYEV